MRTIWQSLVWKEWHEHKWKLVSLTAILWSIAALGLVDLERGSLVGIHVVLVMAIVPLAIFIGLGSATSEQSRNTLRFLQALPVPMWRVAIHKLASGLSTVFIPAFLTVAFVFVWLTLGSFLGSDYYADLGEEFFDFQDGPFVLTDQWYANMALGLMLAASGFYFWTVAAGVNRKDEVSAGAVALTVIMTWCLLVFAAWGLYYNTYGSFSKWPSVVGKWFVVAGAAAAPGGLGILADATDDVKQYLLPAACVTGVTMLFLAAWYVYRFGRGSDTDVRSPKTAEVAARQLDWLGHPRRSAVTAIAWKQFRESGPLALVGVAVVLAVSGTIFVIDWPHLRRDDFGRFLEFIAAVSFSIGLAVAMIIGIGVFLYDVAPSLSTFWRSRPINPNLWFWTKFSSGLAVALVAIYGPFVLIALPRITSVNFNDNELRVFPAITVAVFAAAAAMTCLVRNAVYAAILSIAVVYLGYVFTALAVAGARIVQSGIWPENLGDVFTEVTASQASAGLFITFLVCALVAWLAMRNDWGWKSRY